MKKMKWNTYIKAFLKNLRLIVAITVAMAVVFGVVTSMQTDVTYTSHCSMYAMNTNENTYAGAADFMALLQSDAVLTDVEVAMSAMGEVTGATIREDITARIFERFCVGK